jgi:transcription elongation factor S-II
LKISSSAQDILTDWKKVVSSEACANTNSSKKKPDSLSKSVPSSQVPEADSLVAMPSTVHVKSTKFSQIKVKVTEVSKTELKTTETRSTVTTLVSEVDVKNDQRNTGPVAPFDSSSLVMELAPQIGTIPKAGGDSARDRVRELMVEALAKVWKEAGDDDLEKVKSIDVVQVAVAVESALFAKLGLSKGKEKAKYRFSTSTS